MTNVAGILEMKHGKIANLPRKLHLQLNSRKG